VIDTGRESLSATTRRDCRTTDSYVTSALAVMSVSPLSLTTWHLERDAARRLHRGLEGVRTGLALEPVELVGDPMLVRTRQARRGVELPGLRPWPRSTFHQLESWLATGAFVQFGSWVICSALKFMTAQ
jgi:hypothetical protein